MPVINVPDIALSLGLNLKMLSFKDDLSLQNLVSSYKKRQRMRKYCVNELVGTFMRFMIAIL